MTEPSPILSAEQVRLRALRALEILDTPPEQIFDDLVNLSAQLLKVPIALVSLVDESRQWFKSKVGLPVCETPREISFCAQAIRGTDIFVVKDTLKDEGFKNNPLVTGAPFIRFYAGAPLITKNGEGLGTLCIIDTVPRELSPLEVQVLKSLAHQVVTQFELRVAQKELARAKNIRQHLEPSLRAAKIGFWHWNVPTGKLDWDDNMHELYGLHPADFSGAVELWERCVHPDDKEQIDTFLREVIKGGALSFSTKFRIITPHGEERYIAAKGDIKRAPDGKALSVSGFNWDITQEESLRVKLDQFGEELRALFRGMREGLVVQNEGGTIIDHNDAAARMLSVTVGQPLIPNTWGVVRENGSAFDPEKSPEVLALRTGEPQSGVVMGLKKPGGELLWLLVNSVPLFRPHERTPYRVMTSFNDITQRKRLEDQLRESRYAEQQANERKSQFLANASHEIRTPLNGILGLSELLSETSLSLEQQELNQSIVDSGRSLLRIINDILDLSKIEAGKLALTLRSINLASFISRLARPFELAAKSKGIRFTVQVDPLPSAVCCDELRLGQVLSNIIGNAIKFTDHGGVHLRVQLLQTSSAGYFIRFEIRDSGVGIEEQTARELFQPFAQGEHVFGGTGLGLSIAKRLTELMNGTINFVSAPRQGATFWVDLLLPPSHDRDVELMPFVSPKPLALPRLGGTVLVAEDNLVNQKLISRILDKVGCSYRIVSSGRAVLEALRSESYDLILMDCMMPEVDGYEATRRIRSGEVPKSLSTPIVALTANAIEGERERCLGCGMDGFIPKPIERDQLAGYLQRYLKPRSEAEQDKD